MNHVPGNWNTASSHPASKQSPKPTCHNMSIVVSTVGGFYQTPAMCKFEKPSHFSEDGI